MMAAGSDYEVVRESLRSPGAFGEIFERHAHRAGRHEKGP
jgi:hypothetical protein